MIVKDILDALRFLRKEGYDVNLILSEEFPYDSRKELSEFVPNSVEENNLSLYSVYYDNIEIAKTAITKDGKEVSLLIVPIKYMLYALYEETRKTISEANEHDVYRKALQFIREHYTENIAVSDVARHIGYSESYFGYAFKKKYKMSVGQYIRELQLAKAKDLLENTSFSVSSVASYVGFDDSNYFSLLFKKYFGLSPKEYRNLNSALK